VGHRLAIALAATGLLAGCGGTSHHAPSSRARAQTVLISSYAFHPSHLIVPEGTHLAFANRDHTSHTATASGGVFDTGTIQAGRAATIVLTKPGNYSFYCQFHAFMRGEITVRKTGGR
jgi:plastocyanin